MTPIPETVPPTEVRMAEIVFPNHTNHLGTLFGGQALAWMDKAALSLFCFINIFMVELY